MKNAFNLAIEVHFEWVGTIRQFDFYLDFSGGRISYAKCPFFTFQAKTKWIISNSQMDTKRRLFSDFDKTVNRCEVCSLPPKCAKNYREHDISISRIILPIIQPIMSGYFRFGRLTTIASVPEIPASTLSGN